MTRRPLLALAGVALLLAPASLLAHPGEDWRDGAPEPALSLSAEVDATIQEGMEGQGQAVMGIDPGQGRFQGEWAFGTCQMAAAGHAQLALLHPEHAAVLVPRAERAMDCAIAEATWSFDRQAWGDLALEHLDDDAHDHAVLGYLGVSLGLLRLAAPDTRHAALHDRVAAALARRIPRGPVLETYPGEAYPVDHAMGLATVALHARATGQAPPAWLPGHLARYRERFVDEHGLLVQSASPSTGRPRSVGRGSGTTLAAWALSWVDPELSRALTLAVREGLADRRAGVAMVREYHPSTCARGHGCQGDVDSGPLILGASVSATGFALAGARRLQDETWFDALWGTTRLFGGWTGSAFTTGGPLGNAIMLAMLTAPTPDELAEARR
ncbi:hypothetical protein L6R53_23120 [Myxococcota bacterium]|nr:hypothetical protein [Myxococcota bacterium]